MKVGLVCPYHIFRGGGVQECVFALQKELTARGHTAKIITPLPRDVTDEDRHNESVVFVGTSANVKSPFHTTAQVSVSLDNNQMNAMLEAEQAITRVINGERNAVELTPRESYVRRLQHPLAERYNVNSESRGREPHRRVKIYRG